MVAKPCDRSIIVMTRNYEPLCKVSPERAFCLIYTDRAVGYSFSNPDYNEFITLKSVNGEYYVPKVIILKSAFEISLLLKRTQIQPTKRNIFTRDGSKCGYCGKKATTLDHIVPQSKGGGNTWDNLVAACHKCNNSKADKSPEEAGMKLLNGKLKAMTTHDFTSKLLDEFLEICEVDTGYGS